MNTLSNVPTKSLNTPLSRLLAVCIAFSACQPTPKDAQDCLEIYKSVAKQQQVDPTPLEASAQLYMLAASSVTQVASGYLHPQSIQGIIIADKNGGAATAIRLQDDILPCRVYNLARVCGHEKDILDASKTIIDTFTKEEIDSASGFLQRSLLRLKGIYEGAKKGYEHYGVQ